MSAIIKKITITVIHFYQFSISPDHGVLRVFFPNGVCRYTPSCSQYMIEALQYHGWRGLFMGIKRISRCHPFASGGFDPVDIETDRPGN